MEKLAEQGKFGPKPADERNVKRYENRNGGSVPIPSQYRSSGEALRHFRLAQAPAKRAEVDKEKFVVGTNEEMGVGKGTPVRDNFDLSH